MLRRLAKTSVLCLLLCVLALPLSVSAGQSVPVPAGLIGWWTGNQDGSDSSGNGYAATLFNGASAGNPGKVGGAFQLNGINSYVGTPVLVPGVGTLDFWVKPLVLDSVDGIIGTFGLSNGNDRLWINARGPQGGIGVGPNNIVVNISSSSVNEFIVPTPLQIGTWTNMAFTFDYPNGQFGLYFNGQLAATATVTRNTPTQPLQIGTNQSDFGQNFYLNGLMDEVALFNRVLGSSEIAGIYAAGDVGMNKGNPVPIPPSLLLLAPSLLGLTVIRRRFKG